MVEESRMSTQLNESGFTHGFSYDDAQDLTHRLASRSVFLVDVRRVHDELTFLINHQLDLLAEKFRVDEYRLLDLLSGPNVVARSEELADAHFDLLFFAIDNFFNLMESVFGRSLSLCFPFATVLDTDGILEELRSIVPNNHLELVRPNTDGLLFGILCCWSIGNIGLPSSATELLDSSSRLELSVVRHASVSAVSLVVEPSVVEPLAAVTTAGVVSIVAVSASLIVITVSEPVIISLSLIVTMATLFSLASVSVFLTSIPKLVILSLSVMVAVASMATLISLTSVVVSAPLIVSMVRVSSMTVTVEVSTTLVEVSSFHPY